MHARTFLTLSLLAPVLGCSHHLPARFASHPPIVDAHDDRPTAVPQWLWTPEPVYLSEIYLHRPLREALDLSLYPEAADVNSADEIAASSWFTPRIPEVAATARGWDTLGPPLAPFTVVAETPFALASDAFTIIDSRGRRYEVTLDPSDRPEMRTSTVVIASRLLWAIGYNTPPASIFRAREEDFWHSEGAATDVTALLRSGAPPLHGYHRLVAVGWPTGVLLGYAPESGVRSDDPNDTVPHENRRTLRALKVFAAWLALDGLGPAKTVDRYMGAPGEGHVVHYIVGLDEALGAANIARATDPPPSEGGGSAITRLLTLGLFPNPRREPTQTEMPALGELPEQIDPTAFAPPLPYEPADRLLGPDGYWAAKRMLGLSSTHIALAIAAGAIGDPRAERAMTVALEKRRQTLAAYWFGRVTPLEVLSVSRSRIALRDEAVHRGLVAPNVTEYHVDFMASDGTRASAGFDAHPEGAVLELALPKEALGPARDYVVVLIRGARNGSRLPRTFELHLKLERDDVNVVGVRH